MNITDLKFTSEEIYAKCIKNLADRPELSAAEMKDRLDSGDIRKRFNELIDYLAERI